MFGIVLVTKAQGQDLYLSVKGEPKEVKPGSSSIVIGSIDDDRKYLVINHQDTEVSSDYTKMNMKISANLLDLESGEFLYHGRNQSLYFFENNLASVQYKDIWGQYIDTSKFLEEALGQATTDVIDPRTRQRRFLLSLPDGQSFAGVQKDLVLSMNFSSASPETRLWRRSGETLVEVGRYPFSSGTLSTDGQYLTGVEHDYVQNKHGLMIYPVEGGASPERITITDGVPLITLLSKKYLFYSYMKTGGDGVSHNIRVLDRYTHQVVEDFKDVGVNLVLDQREKYLVSHLGSQGKAIMIDLESMRIVMEESVKYVKPGESSTETSIVLKVGKGEQFLICNPNGILNLLSAKHKKVIADIYVSDGEWVVVARDGRVDGTAGAIEQLEWRSYDAEGQITKRGSLTTAFSQSFTPGLLSALLKDEVSEASDLSQVMSQRPTVQIVNPEDGYVSKDAQVTVMVEAQPQGDPIAEILLYVNGKLVEGESRGFKPVNDRFAQSYTVSLIKGENVIAAKAVSIKGYESGRDQIRVQYHGMQATADLYVLAVGVDQYVNGAYNLNYAVSDARSVVRELQLRSEGIFDAVYVDVLYDQDANRQRTLAALQSIASRAKPEDVFVFFYAGHGVMSEEASPEFYLALTGVTQLYGKTSMLQAHGVSASELKQLTVNILAQKQMVVLDACQSGGAVEAFARRGAAEEKAIVQLARSSGATLLASTGSEQYATEFDELGHGVFTYALLQGLAGAADGGMRDKKITVKELEAYLNDQIPILTHQYHGESQFPRSWSSGQDFPLVLGD
ncbi:hypothetical protein BFP72_14845 [Reichenbachiella sp. 5M10]|nr:hypothetical protein BFP72_14845 [Reichenbachiella sp. 5M10]